MWGHLLLRLRRYLLRTHRLPLRRRRRSHSLLLLLLLLLLLRLGLLSLNDVGLGLQLLLPLHFHRLLLLLLPLHLNLLLLPLHMLSVRLCFGHDLCLSLLHLNMVGCHSHSKRRMIQNTAHAARLGSEDFWRLRNVRRWLSLLRNHWGLGWRSLDRLLSWVLR